MTNPLSLTTSSAAGRVHIRTGTYAALIVLGLFGGLLLNLRTQGIFACPAGSFGTSGYLAYCQAGRYGDYDHGAVWFALEPEVIAAVRDAQVVFVGSSRMQFAFSSDLTRDWFETRDASYYLLGFSHTENAGFFEPLLERLDPSASVFVLNVDRLFDLRPTQPAQAVMSDAEALKRYRTKQRWQPVHRTLCASVPAMCGDHAAFYRERATGFWRLEGTESAFEPAPVSEGDASESADNAAAVEIASSLIRVLGVAEECVILTLVPYHGTRRAEAVNVARSLGMELISPRVDGLSTFDGSHLDPASATRWSRAFFDAAGERIERCLGPASVSS